MSTEDQRYSIANQEAAISAYAGTHGYEIVCTYADRGESGLTLRYRKGLQSLLSDVIKGSARYKKIIVLDVSRWGRFQDPDEAAHYEFVCRNRGIEIEYCAEEFHTCDSVADYVAKVLKRLSSAEYCHELSIRSFENHRRTVQLGFRVGSHANYGFRRMAVGTDGKFKNMLRTGQSKTLVSDRVTLVHGPKRELDCIHLIFKLCLRRKKSSEIARELNRRRIRRNGSTWKPWMIDKILRNPIYTGTYVWNRRTQKLGSKATPNKRELWVVKRDAVPAIVSRSVFDRAQQTRRRRRSWTDAQLLDELRRLLAKKGYLSERLIQTPGGPALATFHKRLGTFERIYELIGYTPGDRLFQGIKSRAARFELRMGLFRQIEALFLGRVKRFRLAGNIRELLSIDDRTLSIIVCPFRKRPERTLVWSLTPVLSERKYLTLICRLNPKNEDFLSFHLFPRIEREKLTSFTGKHAWFKQGVPVNSLEELPGLMAKMQP